MNFLMWLNLAAGIAPLVMSVEQAVKVPQSGQQKSALVLSLIQEAANASGVFAGGKVNPATIATAATNMINGVVHVLNLAGIFHHDVPPAPAQP